MYLDPNIFNNENYRLLLIFLYSVFATFVAIPYVMKKCRQYGYMVKDMHKWGRPTVPVLGGIAILIGVLVSLSLSQLLLNQTMPLGNLFVFYFVAIVYAMYGILDDLFHFKVRYSKIIVLLVLSLPLVSLIPDQSMTILGVVLPYWAIVVLIPIYIMIVSNLINIHSSFNGLSPGLTLILLIAAGIKSYMLYGTIYLIYLMPILGALLVFFWFNKYPSKIFEGNIGSFLYGSSLGAFLIVSKLELFGVIVLIPHIISFILDTWVLAINKVPDKEFPRPRKDGIIIPDITMRYKSLKNVLCTWFRLTEHQATNLSFVITAIFCVIGVIFI